MRLTIRNEEAYARAVKHLDDVWRRERNRSGISLLVLPYVKPITPPQRTKMFAMIHDLADRTGNSSAYLREYFERTYGTTTDDGAPKALTEYTSTEASSMIERVIQVAAEQGHMLR